MSDYGLFWNSRSGDRLYSADSMEEWLKPFFVTGVFNGDLQVTATSGMGISVATGYCNVEGKIRKFSTATTFTLSAASGLHDRVDTVVIERDDANRQIILKVVEGGSDGQPTAPVRADGVYQLVLAQIAVGQGVTSISQANITDTRTSSTLCGYVCATVTEIEFDQIAAQFEGWFDDFKDDNEDEMDEWKAGYKSDADDWIDAQELAYSTWVTAEKKAYDDWIDEQEAAYGTWVTNTKKNYDDWVEESEGDYTDWITENEANFTAWYNRMKDQLSEDAAGHLQAEVDKTFNAASYNDTTSQLVFTTVDNTSVPVTISGGHDILNSSGTEMPKRKALQFNGMTVADDSTNDKTVITGTQLPLSVVNGKLCITYTPTTISGGSLAN